MGRRRDILASRNLLAALAEASSPGGAGRRSRPAQPLLCIALLSLAACGENDPAFTKLFTSDHFDYYVEQGATPPCDGVDQWLERYYSANAKFLGAELPPGERIQYYLGQSPASLGCPPDSGGC